MSVLALTPDELLTTTRSVRKRLDLTRPVDRAVIKECLAVAQQAPTGGNAQNWHFVVVTDAGKRAQLADLYRRGWGVYLPMALEASAANPASADPVRQAAMARLSASAQHLVDHLHDVPVHVVPCFAGRVEGQPPFMTAGMYGSVIQAGWSLMLAARARGLAGCWTTIHLLFEEEAARILGIPYDRVTQVALIALAHALGTGFKPAPREPLDTAVHWDNW